MNLSKAVISNKSKDRPVLLVLCLLFSILLHLLIVFSLPYEKLRSDNLVDRKQQPTIVRLIDKPPTDQEEYELDQHPTQPRTEQETKSSRLAEQSQRVEKEFAPKGDDTRDRTAKPTTMQAARPAPTQTATTTNNQQQQQETRSKAPNTPKFPSKKNGSIPPQSDNSLPPIEQLTQLSPNTLIRLNSSERATQERIKQRDDVDEGDTVWLNLKRGLLISFFRRFHNQIEGVWNYPREAIENEMQGTLLLKITVAADGELLDVDLLQSSGYELLDYEAIQAVYRAAPFGPLGKHYPHPDLKIMAHFRYMISGKYIYGQPR